MHDELDKITSSFLADAYLMQEEMFDPPDFEDILYDPPEEERENTSQELANQHKKQQIGLLSDTRKLRKYYALASAIFATVTVIFWAIMSAVFFFCPGLVPSINFNIYATFTAGCTVNILASFLAVTKGLFAIEQNK